MPRGIGGGVIQLLKKLPLHLYRFPVLTLALFSHNCEVTVVRKEGQGGYVKAMEVQAELPRLLNNLPGGVLSCPGRHSWPKRHPLRVLESAEGRG